jgi:hypothetical protein
VATLVLAVNAVLVIQAANSIDSRIASFPPAAPDNTLPDFQSTTLKASQAAATNPTTWISAGKDAARGFLLTSRTYLLKEGKLFDPIEGQENLHDPIPNAWIFEHKLDITDPDIKSQDNDGDGFSNLEEFLAGKSPVDPQSKPAGYNKLKLVGFKSLPFRIVFKGDPSGTGTEFQLNFLELKGSARTQYKKIGDVIEGAPYKIVSYQEKKFTDESGIPRDESALTLQNTDNGGTITLVKDKQTDDPGSEGTFLNEITGETFVQKKGGTFTLQPDRIEFKIIDITPSSAQIQDTTTGQTYPISKATKDPQ